MHLPATDNGVLTTQYSLLRPHKFKTAYHAAPRRRPNWPARERFSPRRIALCGMPVLLDRRTFPTRIVFQGRDHGRMPGGDAGPWIHRRDGVEHGAAHA